MHMIADKLMQVEARLQQASHSAHRPRDAIALLAVSKTQPPARLREAYSAGQRRFGENYLQEAQDKQQALADLAIEWHFIGPIQSNKTQAIAQAFDWVHSVDRLKIARRLSEQRPPEAGPLNICLQVNIDGEATKSGASPEALPALALAVAELPNLRLRGLMAIPAPCTDPEAQRQAFARVRALKDALQAQGLALDTLSMGMSGDLEAAIAEGATLVRVGTDIFGPRMAR
ncbi:YggS family pyridoxal phosphate-dependent enzyme [Simiduia sp. 21SJ11W-1]|uniref:YggS family pyridoxal phosphate-dependent enzyme n=1 Tax=Simiduia sp. 21SJ11W-1 TaxID=2909669 RepID=UPI0020A14797|nr:YggS family pyridoxal phosphate-dependent enzyme [Simiduia sp. 21SJ11W-1]UTA48222.1 YggS family pyridoxal phosphate-dependent enzyme [Simiduia sp. 21SJ11W-1]